MTILNNTLTDIEGVRVGHFTHEAGATGCTVILCPEGTIGAVDVRGGAPGTRETDLLSPHNQVETIHAVLLAGGSAYGLAAADGVVRYLEERGIGYPAQDFIVPIVPAAILFDLPVGEPGIRPDASMGYAACEAANAEPVAQGSVGAGTGARVGVLMGNDFATKGGIGSASVDLGDGLIVAALVAVNALGDVLDESGTVIAGLRQPPDGNQFTSTLEAIRGMARLQTPDQSSHTVIGVIATNARLTKAHAQKVAMMAHDGIARAVNPAHTMLDGDTIFALATGDIPANPSVIGAYAAEVMAAAIRNAVRYAAPIAGIRTLNDKG